MGLDHINLQHFEHIGVQNVSKFSGEVGARQLRDIIQSGLSDPSRIVTQQGARIVVESNVGRVIGTTQSGAATTWIRTIFTADGTVITSYPIPKP